MQPISARLRIAIYARFSSSRQDERSIADQVRRCREYVDQHLGGGDNVEVFADYAVSGASIARRAFEAMMASVDDGTISTIVTEDISRISRDFADAAQIFKRLQYTRVPLIGVADGINTSAKNAKLSFTLKSLIADIYLDDLRDRTLRGLEGRALAGYATGRGPFGFTTRPEIDGSGRELGKKIVIDEAAARIVVRIFTQYAEGQSMSWISRSLNQEGIPSPRAQTRHRFAGWSVGSVREMLRNEKYIGVWRFKEMQWVKVPGSNRRQPRKRSLGEVITTERPDMRIIDLPLWEAAQLRIAQGHPLCGRRRMKTRSVLAGVFICAHCNAPMTCTGGSLLMNTAYYHCSTNRTKGLCTNWVSIRSSTLVRDIFAAIRETVVEDARVLRAIETQNEFRDCVLKKQLDEATKNLAAAEAKIARLVAFVANGEQFECVLEAMRDLELTARSRKAELEGLRNEMKKPIRRVSIQEIGATISRIGATAPEDADTVRERVRRWLGSSPMRFTGTHIEISLQPSALVSDVARDGTLGPQMPDEPALTLRVSVKHLAARGASLGDGLAA